MKPKPKQRPSFDVLGLVTLVLGLSGLVLAIMQGPVWGWSAPWTLIFFGSGLLGVLAFIWVELRASSPLIELHLFRNPTFTGSNLVVYMAQFSKMAVIVFGALYLQKALHLSPFQAGLGLLPAMGCMGLLVVFIGKLSDRTGPRWLSLGGLFLSTLGLLALAGAVKWKTYPALVPGLVLWGLGMSFLFAPPRRAVMDAVPVEKQGQASGIVMTAQMLGATIGMAACSTLLRVSENFEMVFIGTAGMSVAVLVTGWFTIER